MHGVGGQAKGEEAPKQNLNEYHGFADPPRKVHGDVSVKKNYKLPACFIISVFRFM